MQQHVSFPQHAHQLVPKHATQLTKTTVPVAVTVSRRIDPEQTELEEDSIPSRYIWRPDAGHEFS